MTTTKIYLVTPCFNAVETIDQTIANVVAQSGPFELYFHVQDGASSDGTLKRLQDWQTRLDEGVLPIFCKKVVFSFESGKDGGMYDAIARGFSRFEMDADAWLTWINADDMLAPGACALMSVIDGDERGGRVEWVAGSAAVVSSGSIVGQSERYLTANVMRHGLCDGQHWEFVQQEGTFFRKKLWDTIDEEADFTSLKLAGDWNLWRRFAQSADLYQVKYPLGLFHERPGQLSQSQRSKYLEEIDTLVPQQERTEMLIKLVGKPLTQKRLAIDYKTRTLQFPERDLSPHLTFRLGQRFGEERAAAIVAAGWADEEMADFVEKTAAKREVENPVEILLQEAEQDEALDVVKYVQPLRTDVIAHDADWQFPAITEAYAFQKAKEILPYVPGVCYLAFPWATLFDQCNSADHGGKELLQALRELRVPDAGYERVITVCQHIHMGVYADLLTQAGVTDVFWSHAIKDQTEIRTADGKLLRIHPFPLYPVQAIPIDRSTIHRERSKLYSFVGAKSNIWYLTEARTWLIEQLGDDPRGVVKGRDGWHYQKIVYDHQIQRNAAGAANLVDEDASKVFRELLLDSTFSLCPSGSGPNSIRLWESVGAGSIPVVLADTYKAPGDQKLWRNAVVFCEESPEAIAALPERLEALAGDEALVDSMRKHLDQLWMLYGPDTFVYDVQRLYLEISSEFHAARNPGPPLVTLARKINTGQLSGAEAFENFLKMCAARLDVSPTQFREDVERDGALRRACEYALSLCEKEALTCRIRSAWREAGLPALNDPTAVAAKPVSVRRHRVHLFGRHSNRTPMGYKSYHRLFAKQIDYVSDIWSADTIVTGFDIDIRSVTSELSPTFQQRPEMQALVVSEEPLWDTVWANALREHTATAGKNASAVPYAVANHVNSDVFKFDRIPYFITTDDKFFQRYAQMFQRNSALTPEALLDIWKAAPVRTAFYAEKRLEDRFDVFYPDLGVRGLCAYRTRIAQIASRKRIVRVGQGWDARAAKRQNLADWHLDKLVALNRKALIISGLENTHHADYITEKPFDAFAALGVPLYYASPAHRIHEVLPEGGFINLYNSTEVEAGRLIDEFEPDLVFARAYLATQKRLARLFSDPETLNRERSRVVSAVLRLL